MNSRNNDCLFEGANKLVSIVSCSSRSETESLCDAVARLKYRARLVSTQSWLQENAAGLRDPGILLLSAAGLSDTELCAKILRKVSLSRYLAVFYSRITDVLLPILQLCPECCCWPCDQPELALRLKRVCCPSDCSASASCTAETWARLNLVGSSPAFLRSLTFIEQAARCDVPVLIEGETGTGKEMAARAIHYLSGRRDYPFIPINCGAIPDDLIVNELFGHEKGAFTDASQSQSGQLAEADGGTLLLDEIEALSFKGQVALLRFIEDQTIKPLGGKTYRKVNVRIIAASNALLSELVSQGSFRQDLLFRLNLLQWRLPPLRERIQDIRSLAHHFIERFRCRYRCHYKQLTHEALAWMDQYPWPGNVRELENTIHRMFIVDEAVDLAAMDCARPSAERRKADRRVNCDLGLPFNEAKRAAIHQFEWRYLTDVIARTHGNVSQSACLARKERRALGKLLKKHHIDPAKYRARDAAPAANSPGEY